MRVQEGLNCAAQLSFIHGLHMSLCAGELFSLCLVLLGLFQNILQDFQIIDLPCAHIIAKLHFGLVQQHITLCLEDLTILWSNCFQQGIHNQLIIGQNGLIHRFQDGYCRKDVLVQCSLTLLNTD